MPFVDADGARVHYRVDGQGPGLVLVHGTGGNAEISWTPMLQRLTARYTVVRPDYAGSGLTQDSGGPLSVPGLAAQVAAAAEAAGLESFHLLGFSLGSAVAVQVAADHPARVRKLVALGGFACADDSRLQMMLKLWKRLIARDPESLARVWVLSGFSPAALSRMTADEIEQIVALNLAGSDWNGIDRQLDANLGLDIRAAAARVTVPALVVGFSQDQMVPPDLTRRLAGLIPRADYAEVDSGHAAPAEAWEALLDLAEPFFAAAAGR